MPACDREGDYRVAIASEVARWRRPSGFCLGALLVALSLLAPWPAPAQDDPDLLTSREEQELKTLLAEALKAKPGTSPLSLTDPASKRQFDLASRVAQYGLLRINKSMMDKVYAHDSDFVAFYMSRFSKLFDEKAKTAWLLAYAAQNEKEKAFFEKELGKTGLQGDKRNTILLAYYHLPRPAERVYYIELVSIVYKNGQADFSPLPKRAKDWIAAHNDLFP